MKLNFSLQNQDENARAGNLNLQNTPIPTPMFMPVGTLATVKAILPEELKAIGYKLILGNAYHLHLRPGDELVANLGGLHRFMNWDQGILTDSGGFQLFSLAKLLKIEEQGVEFRSHLDGSKHWLSPEKSIQIQENLGSNIMMVFDHCISLPATYDAAAQAVERTYRWAKRSKQAHQNTHNLFGIVQGATFEALRQHSAELTQSLDFDGYAIGGLSVGETREELAHFTQITADFLPASKPRYLMGVGDPLDLLQGISAGVDLFDCVLPTRNARNGCLLTSKGKLSIKQARFIQDSKPLDEACNCPVCQNYSRAYLNHLYKSGEILASRLNTYHNLYFLYSLVEQARQAIIEQRFMAFKKNFETAYNSGEF